jgi:hypothetical protein
VTLSRRAVAWLAWWFLCFWLWLVYVGEWNRYAWVSGAVAASIGATAALVVHHLGLLRFRPAARPFLGAWRVPVQVVVDFGILVAALWRVLVLRREVRGVFRAKRVVAGGDDPAASFRRAWKVVAATYSPNAYVVDVDPERDTVLLHDLVSHEPSERPL